MIDARRLVALLAILTIVTLACAPGGGPAGGPDTRVTTQQASPKVLNIALQNEPITMLMYGRVGEGGTTTARYERYMTMQAQLTSYGDDLQPVAWAAVKVPSISDGDWKLNADGSMEVIWKIRADAYWHDGQRLTADDFVFGMEVIRDPRLAVAGLGELTKIGKAEAPDATTLAVSWKSISVQANANFIEGIPAIPRRLAEEQYRTLDKEGFEGSQLWRNEFVGTGPYKLVSWDLGGSYTLEAFDRYFLGRPKIDRLVYTYAADPQLITAKVLSGAVDLVPPGTTIKPESMTSIRQQWGNRGVVMAAPNDHRMLTVNQRDSSSAWSDVRFRQAMLYALNRPELTESIQHGWIDPAWYWGFPQDPVYQAAEQAKLPKYEYDANRAQQMLASLGWTKGPDGILHNVAGERLRPFVCCRVASEQDTNDVRESLAIGSMLKAIGIDAVHPVADPPAGMAGTAARRWNAVERDWGGTFGNFRVTAEQYWATFVAVQIPGESNGWNGLNTTSWKNDRYEDFFARAQSALDPRERQGHNFELMKVAMEQLPALPVYFNPLGLVVRQGLEGVKRQNPLNRAITENIHLWDLK